MPQPIATKANGKGPKPGFLLKPLGWIHNRLRKAIAIDPTLVGPLLDLDHGRMHLIALALAHLPGDVPPVLALTLLQGSKKAILDRTVGYHPVGIDRALAHLPPKVLAAAAYRNLVELLDDSVTAKFLHHRPSIENRTIMGLHSLP
ncbi:MAG: hypothetical protein ACRDRB_25720, partial [Pseudonocardiaceae bacterium]